MPSRLTPGEKDVEKYLSAVPEPQQSTLRALRTTIKALLPLGEDAMSYGVPVIKVNGKSIAGYAAAKKHCSYFPHSGQVIEDLAADLTRYDCSKGTLRFAIDKPLPKTLVKKLIRTRLSQLGF
jgi:uncharacterized protein YdhG (YjbR/CyaY superfamily)